MHRRDRGDHREKHFILKTSAFSVLSVVNNNLFGGGLSGLVD
jgi:hypothetical protein